MKQKSDASPAAVLLVHCPDQKGLVAAVTSYLFRLKANIIDLDQHVDIESEQFFMRVAWELEGFELAANQISNDFKKEIADRFEMSFQLHISGTPMRMAVFVTKMSHCLYDLLQRTISGEWNVEIPLIISNHTGLRSIAEQFGIPYFHFVINPDNKSDQEEKILALLEKEQIDFLVLARYMQIISKKMIQRYPNKIINIHHSFLPAFIGARPYHQAFERGVKIIGATSHYVTQDLDAGPIIAQDVEHITHKDSVGDLVRKGKDLEKLVLAKAVWNHLQHNILPYKNRTFIF
ncbi:MAG: formyltetrahydrofolate deformylase [Saprospiraceae bacterium]|nr:formyltetrahydrofolate deformylase [Saprospiraceae bacterium]